MKKIVVLLLCLSLLALCAACQTGTSTEGSKPEEETTGSPVHSTESSKPKEETTEPSADPVEIPLGSLDSFDFSLTWGCYGISSYDSQTGKLVKTTDATHPEDYVTTYQLTEEQKKQIYDWIEDLQVTGYPDTYNPHPDGLLSSPTMTLILSVQTDTVQKTIQAKDIAISYDTKDEKGKKFLTVCGDIETMLKDTEEWKAFPEYEFFYE